MFNASLLIAQIFGISFITFLCLKIGRQAVNSWLVVLAISLNLMILKQVNIFGLDVTTCKALGVCYILGLNLMQEYYGKREAQVHVLIAALCTFGFVMLQQMHMIFLPNEFDTTQGHYSAIFSCMPLITAVSFITLIFIQLLDIRFFGWLQDVLGARRLTTRDVISLAMSQTVDTLVFYGLLSFFEDIWGNVWHVIAFTLIIKFMIIFMITPYTALARRFVDKEAIARY